jgi:hypothetical protein
VLPARANARAAETANPFTTAAARQAVVLFVPLDERAHGLLTKTFPPVARYLHDPYTLTAVPTSKANWMNQARGQMNSAVVMDDIAARYRRAQGNRIVLLMMVTSKSMYGDPNISFAFTTRGAIPAGQNQYRVLTATAQMRVFHPEREQARLTKMMLRHIGEIICKLKRNGNPKSVMYQPIVSDADLDRMVAVLPSHC